MIYTLLYYYALNMHYDDALRGATDAFSRLDAGEIGGALVCLGLVLWIGLVLKRWIKARGFRMAVQDRNNKLHAFLLDLLNDGLFEAEVAGKFSRQEVQKAYEMLAAGRYRFRDLVSKKRIARDVKSELKSRKFLREQAKIPPKEEVEKSRLERKKSRVASKKARDEALAAKSKFKQTMGKAMFWKKDAA